MSDGTAAPPEGRGGGEEPERPVLPPDFYRELLAPPSCRTCGVCDGCGRCEH